jgi:sulfur relay (sulfurtransferase) complex TusBCD TusD component (DsrE family)
MTLRTKKVPELETMTIIVNGAPYGEERVWNALRLALTSVSAAIDLNLSIFLLGDAVSAATKKT